MNARIFLAALSLGFVTACAQMSPRDTIDAPPISMAVQASRPTDNHQALAEHFDSAARQMQVKADEQKKLLQHYEDKSYLYGREAQDLISHTAALVRKYNQAVNENIREASAHRKMALDEVAQAKSSEGDKIAGYTFTGEQQISN